MINFTFRSIERGYQLLSPIVSCSRSVMWTFRRSSICVPRYHWTMDVRGFDVPPGRLCRSDSVVRLCVHIYVDLSGSVPCREETSPL